MPCNQKIFQAIENNCTPIKGIQSIAKWAFRSDIAFTFVDNTITAIATPTLPLGLFKSFKFGLNAGHEIKTYENYPDRFTHKFMGVSSEPTDALDTIDDIVVFVQPNGSTTWKVYGAKNGLWKTSQSFMTNDNMGTTAFEFASREGLEEIYECYNTSIDISALVDMDSFDLIYNGTIANGGTVKLSVDTDKTGYIKLPNGTLLTTVAGVINTTYSGIGGNITYYIPKNSVNYDISASDLAGNVNVNICQPTIGISTFLSFGCGNITSLNIVNLRKALVYGSSSLSTLIMPHTTDLIASSCALTAKSIGDILYSAYIDNRLNVNYDFSGGTNANADAIGLYLDNTYNLTLSGEVYDDLVANGGTILLNP